MSNPSRRSAFLLPTVLGLLAALFLWTPSEAQAQIVFDVQLSEEGRELLTAKRKYSPEKLVGIVGEHGIIIFEGKAPVSAKQIIFIVGERGEIRERVASEPFDLEPGKQRLGERFPRDRFLALFERLFPDSIFFPDSHFFPDSFFIPVDALESGREEEVVSGLFREMDLKEGQVGAVVLLAPVNPDVEAPVNPDVEEVQTRPMGFVLTPSR